MYNTSSAKKLSVLEKLKKMNEIIDKIDPDDLQALCDVTIEKMKGMGSRKPREWYVYLNDKDDIDMESGKDLDWNIQDAVKVREVLDGE